MAIISAPSQQQKRIFDVRQRIIKQEPSFFSWFFTLLASFAIDVIAYGAGVLAGAIATYFTFSPAIGYIVAGSVQAGLTIAGNFLLDYFTDNLYKKDGSIKWDTVTLNILPVLGFAGLGKIKQGFRLLRQERFLINSLKEINVSQKVINLVRLNATELLDKNFFLKVATKTNDVAFVTQYLSDVKSANNLKITQKLKGILFTKKDIAKYTNNYQINLITTKIQQTQTFFSKKKNITSALEKILTSKTSDKIYKGIQKGTQIVRFLNPAYTIRYITEKTLRPIAKVINKKIAPLLKKITKKSKYFLKLYVSHGIIPVNSTVILGYRVLPVGVGFYQVEFFFRGKETNFKKNIKSRPLTTAQFTSWTLAPSPMNWYLDNIAFSRGGHQKGGGTLFGSISKQITNYGGLNPLPTQTGRWAYQAYRVYRAYQYVRKFGVARKKWQGWKYWETKVKDNYKNYDYSNNIAEQLKKKSIRKALKIAGATGIITRVATQILSKDKKKRKRVNRTTKTQKITSSTLTFYKSKFAKRIRRKNLKRTKF